jgi:hypothetical protein
MLDLRAHLEKPRADAADCAVISKRATDASKRELFATLSEHLNRLAQEWSVRWPHRRKSRDAKLTARHTHSSW